MDALKIIATEVSLPGRLRISAVLDSCYSGAFITEVLNECFKGNLVVPFHLFASCMEDEEAWEDSTLGHGIFTYSFSVRKVNLFGAAATAIQPDNTYGPSLAIAGGELGCTLLSIGAQNPVTYWNGAGFIEMGMQDLKMFDDDGNLRSLTEVRSWLRAERDKILEIITPVHLNRGFTRNNSTTLSDSSSE